MSRFQPDFAESQDFQINSEVETDLRKHCTLETLNECIFIIRQSLEYGGSRQAFLTRFTIPKVTNGLVSEQTQNYSFANVVLLAWCTMLRYALYGVPVHE